MPSLIHYDEALLNIFGIAVVYTLQKQVEAIRYFFECHLNWVARRCCRLVDDGSEELERRLRIHDCSESLMDHCFAARARDRMPRLLAATVHRAPVQFDLVRISQTEIADYL